MPARQEPSSFRSERSPQHPSKPDQTQAVETKPQSRSAIQKYIDEIKPLLIKKNLKNLIRSLVATFTALILLIDAETLPVMGQAGFFTAMVSVMIPATLPVSLFFMACATLLMGMLIGWAWGCAAMAAGLQARSVTLLASTYEKVQAGLNNNPDATFTSSIFAGEFLDPRSSAVIGVFFFFGCFVLGAVRAHIPKFTLLSIFGTIVLDVMCCYGPLFPSQQYTLATLFLIPSSCYVAIGLACTVLIFPESLAHFWLNGMIDGFLKISLALVEFQEITLSPDFPLDSTKLKPHVEKGRALRRKMIIATQGVKGTTGLLDLESTYGRLGPGDLKKFDSKMSFLMSKVLSLQTFTPIVYDSVVRAEQDEIFLSQVFASSSSSSENKPHSHKNVQNLRHLKLRTQISEKERANGHDLEALLPILRSSSSELRQSLIDALKSLIEWLEMANNTRWSKLFKKNDKDTQAKEVEERMQMEEKLNVLRQALVRFKEVERKNLVEGPFGGYFKELERAGRTTDRCSRDDFSAKSLLVCFVFTTTLESCVEAFISFFEFAVQLRAKRPASRLWWPTGFGKLWRKITADDGIRSGEIESPLAGVRDEVGKPRRFDDTESRDDESEEANNDHDEERKQPMDEMDYDEKEPILARDPDASPPRTGFQRASVKIGVFFRWLKSDKGLFSLRYALVSICLWVIAVHPHTAKFSYENRGIWALIMAQTGLAVFAGEQIATFILRISGTVIGCLFGMVAWYIGSGNGNGNPYGIIAATMVILTPWLFMRISLPQQQSVFYMMSSMMIIFVVGYSWIDTHLTVTVNSGKGYEVFWKRVVLVMIGFTAGFIIMCFPKITSARTTVRKTACIINKNIAEIFEDEIEVFLLEAKYDMNTSISQEEMTRLKSRKDGRMKSLSKKLLKTAMIMQAIQPSITVAKFEPQARGPWPKDNYERLIDAQWKFLINTALLSGALSALDPHWCSILVHRTPFLNPELITDIFAVLSLVTQCLYNGHPLPPALHSLRDRLVYHDRSRLAILSTRKISPDESNGDVDSTGTNGDEQLLDPSTEKIDGASMGIQNIGLDTLTDPQFPIHATAIISLTLCLAQIDVITDIVRELCGETGTFRGFDYWKFLNVRDEEKGFRSSFGGRRKKLD